MLPASTRIVLLSVVAILAALLVPLSAAPAQAEQATGDDVPAWSTGWSWTYQTTFRYVGDGADVTINESVTYTVAGTQTFRGQDAYRLGISGTITGGSGEAQVDGVGTAELDRFAGSVSGTRFVRRSDLALLEETQHQSLTARASVSFLSTNISATVDLRLTPQTGWRALAFPLDAGQTWRNDVDVDYDGGFSYDAGSYGSGSDTFAGTFAFDSPATVGNATIGVPAGTVATRRVHSQSGQTVNTHWWSPAHRNDAQEFLQLPLDGATLTLDRRLSASSTPAPGTTVTQTITPSLSCAGGDVTVSGRLSTGAAGVPVTVTLDRSPVSPGQVTTLTTTTAAGGGYTATLQAPAAGDGLAKTGARGSWGVLVSAGGATNAATLVVAPRSCATLAYQGPAGAPQGGTATVSALLVDRTGGSTAGRSVSFTLSDGATVTATTNAAGVAEAELPVAGPPRDATISVSFAGDAGLVAASDSDPFAVGRIPTTTAVVANPPVVTIGEPVRFTATVAPQHGAAQAQGTVQFRVDGSDFGSPVALADGSATSPNLSTLGLGSHRVTAVYAGSADHAASTSAEFTFRVREPLRPTTTTSTVTPATAVYGQPVTLAAEVAAASGLPTGEVVFTSGGEELGRAALDGEGRATLTLDDLPVGSHQVVATYTGDDVYDAGSASPKSVAVSKAPVHVSLAASDTTTVAGEAVSYSASVAVVAPGGGIPDGSVRLLVDGAEVGPAVPLSGGSAVFPQLTSLGAGSHTVAAVYSGSGRYHAASDDLTQTVEQADTTTAVVASPSPSVEGQNVELKAVVAAAAPGSGAPTGTVTFRADGEPIGSAPLQAAGGGSEATLDVADLAPGSYQVTAHYAGDADYHASAAEPISHTVIAGTAVAATTTALTSSANPSTYGELITFRADVDAEDGSAPAGAVQFSVDGQNLGAPVPVGADGVAESPALASPDPGSHTVIAAFRPDPGFSASGDLLTQVVESAGVDLALTSSAPDAVPGEEIRFTATVGSQVPGTGLPTGFVQFSVDGQPLGDAVALEGGTATSSAVPDLRPGDHRVTAVYSGDVHFAPALTEIDQQVARIATTTTLDIGASEATYGDRLVLAVAVTAADDVLGAPGGTVTILDGDEPLTTVAVTAGDGGEAVATTTLTGLGAGTHTLRAAYSGDASFEPSTSATREVTLAKRATKIVADAAVVTVLPLGLPLGQLRTTLTAGTQPLAGAPVEFKIASKTVCVSTTDAKGVATCNAASQVLAIVLSGGYSATFAGDADHLSSSARGVIAK